MGHDTVTDLMLIKGNDKVWSPNERKEILTYAVEEDNTINIVCLDETSSSSDSDGIQSDSENSEIDIDDPLHYNNYIIALYVQ